MQSHLLKNGSSSEGTLLGALELVDHYDEKVAETIHENEEMIDSYEDVISTYLVKAQFPNSLRLTTIKLFSSFFTQSVILSVSAIMR